MSTWHVYIVRCRDGSLYTGIATDLKARITKHNAGKGAKYTRSWRPVKLVWSVATKSGSAARKREARIKQLPRSKKISLVTKK